MILDLKSLIRYNPDTGEFFRLTNAGGGSTTTPVGYKNEKGYLRIKVRQKYYRAHRLAWYYMYNVWPETEIDHIDGDKLNNRISNLRLSNRSDNMVNQTLPREDNKLGVLGVYKIGNKYRATFMRNYLGSFSTVELAKEAYDAAKQSYIKELPK